MSRWKLLIDRLLGRGARKTSDQLDRDALARFTDESGHGPSAISRPGTCDVETRPDVIGHAGDRGSEAARGA